MSPPSLTDNSQASKNNPGSKNKKSKKKKPSTQSTTGTNNEHVNGHKSESGHAEENSHEEEPETPTEEVHDTEESDSNIKALSNGSHPESSSPTITTTDVPPQPSTSPSKESLVVESKDHESNPHSLEIVDSTERDEDANTRFEALAQEREALRKEVASLRQSLEEIQSKHQEQVDAVQEQLEDAQGEKEHAETQYRTLLGKVNTIRSQLGERMKADAEDLAQARSQIEELEEQNSELKRLNEARSAELAQLAKDGEARSNETSKELSTLRNRLTLSQQNWGEERDDLIQREAEAREEFESAKQAMHDWEVLAIEERSIRENLAERNADLEEQVSAMQDTLRKAVSERESQSSTIDGLQRALQDIQEARKQELREIVENTQSQINSLRKELHETQKRATESSKALESTQEELAKALEFEGEVKEKNLLIGKLRHELVIMNDHLRKALKQTKKGKAEDMIDKQLVTNHVIQFLNLDRSDPKKFQVLQIMSGLLDWTDEQRESAGLSRPGASNPNLRTPISPFHRSPSVPGLADAFSRLRSPEPVPSIPADYLSDTGSQYGGRSSRSESISSALRSPP